MFERHDEPHAVNDAERNLKRVLRPLALDDARTRIEGVMLADEGQLAISQVEVVLMPLQGSERCGALSSAGARRTMSSTQGGDPGPHFVPRLHHAPTPENRHTRTQFREINDLPAHSSHKRHTPDAGRR